MVGAILFVTIGIPIIIYVGALLFGGIGYVLENKDLRSGCGWLILIFISLGVVCFGNQRNASYTAARNYQIEQSNKKEFKQSLRNANPQSQGYFIMYETSGQFSTVNNTDGTFTIYNNWSDCYRSLNKYTERYDLNSWDFSCELL